MIRAIIIDDEKHCINRLNDLLREHVTDEVHVMDVYDNLKDGRQAIEKYKPELIFLDVQLDAGQTGFDLLRQVEVNNADIIFTTAYEKYAVQAFRFSALDYLLKPIAVEELKRAVQKITSRHPSIHTTQKLEILLSNLYQKDKRICVPVVNGMLVLAVREIIRCESAINYTTIFMVDRQKITVARTLKEFEELLTEYNFCRIHNSHLVNLAFVRTYNKGKGGATILDDGTYLEVSTRKKEEFLRRIREI